MGNGGGPDQGSDWRHIQGQSQSFWSPAGEDVERESAAPGQEGAVQEGRLGETPGHKCQRVSKGRGWDQRGLGADEPPRQRLLGAGGIGGAGATWMETGSRVCREQEASGKAGIPACPSPPTPQRGLSGLALWQPGEELGWVNSKPLRRAADRREGHHGAAGLGAHLSGLRVKRFWGWGLGLLGLLWGWGQHTGQPQGPSSSEVH